MQKQKQKGQRRRGQQNKGYNALDTRQPSHMPIKHPHRSLCLQIPNHDTPILFPSRDPSPSRVKFRKQSIRKQRGLDRSRMRYLERVWVPYDVNPECV